MEDVTINISHFIVLGFLDQMGDMSGYDIIRGINHRHMNQWTDIKTGSVYHSLTKLSNDGCVEEVMSSKEGLRPTKTIYRITKKGQDFFDKLQEEAFGGLYPAYYGFNLALNLNSRRTAEEICSFAKAAIDRIDGLFALMEGIVANHLEMPEMAPFRKRVGMSISQPWYHLEAERKWLESVCEHASEFEGKIKKEICMDCPCNEEVEE